MAEPESFSGEGRAGDQSDEDDEERIYNPLKLPLAWDGKPIPYWLYKLHGLGVEYPCEICGNYVYMGRRAFDKHFSEAMHIYGLKCLGITSNTNLFREITRIEDAVRLWEKLEQDRKKDRDSRDNVVQMEDAEGNVMPERIYLEYVYPSTPVYMGSIANELQSSKAGHSVDVFYSSFVSKAWSLAVYHGLPIHSTVRMVLAGGPNCPRILSPWAFPIDFQFLHFSLLAVEQIDAHVLT
jgi:hypothetical protein